MKQPCCRLAQHHGTNTLRKGLLDGVSIDLEAACAAGFLDRFPTVGRLDVEFRSQQRPPEHCAALTPAQFDAAWTGYFLLYYCVLPSCTGCLSQWNLSGMMVSWHDAGWFPRDEEAHTV